VRSCTRPDVEGQRPADLLQDPRPERAAHDLKLVDRSMILRRRNLRQQQICGVQVEDGIDILDRQDLPSGNRSELDLRVVARAVESELCGSLPGLVAVLNR
jgi:hypothetical protein